MKRPNKSDYPIDRAEYCYAIENHVDNLEQRIKILKDELKQRDERIRELEKRLLIVLGFHPSGRPLTLQEKMREAANKIKLDM